MDMAKMGDWHIWLEWLLSDFGLGMLALSVVLILFHLIIRLRSVSFYEIVYRWIALFALGFTSIYAGITHVMFPEASAAIIDWSPSPFQFEVGMADIALGVIAVLSFNASYGFRLATVMTATIMFWGDAYGHIYQMLVNQNFSPGNAGSWFWLDIVVPMILLLCIFKLKPSR